MTRTTIVIAAALALIVTLPAMPAQAQANHTFVSAAGSDSNNCASVTTPCRHFANAYAVTNPNGEIFVLDPANYGALTITGPVSIEGHGWASLAAVSGNAAITINANTGDKINIIGVVLDGINIANTTGIQFNSGGSLNVQDSVIRNFTKNGINFTPGAASVFSELFVSNTLISDNGIEGIEINASALIAVSGILDNIRSEFNSGDGLFFQTGPGTINFTISDSVSANNGGDGIFAEVTSGGGTPVIMVRNSTIANNVTDGLQATGTGATIRVTRSTIIGNLNAGWANGSTGTVSSYGDNNIDGNGSNNSTPPSPLTYH